MGNRSLFFFHFFLSTPRDIRKGFFQLSCHNLRTEMHEQWMKFPRISSRDLHCKIKMSMLKGLYKLYHVPILFDMAAFVKLKLMPSSSQGKRATFFLTFFFFFFQACWINERYSKRTLTDLQGFSRSACVGQRGTYFILMFLKAKIVDKGMSSYIFEAAFVELGSRAYGLICHFTPL